MTHNYRTTQVPVEGGLMTVGVFEPSAPVDGESVPTILAIHGVTASHQAWLYLADVLPGVRIIAPDLRGRGASNTLTGPAGMRSHAADLVAVLDAFDLERVPVVGHSMGGFVSLVLAHTAPERVERLMLVDGGLPLAAPPGLTPDELVQAILGPTAARLSMVFENVDTYLDFWKQHPAFPDWNEYLDDYFSYDLTEVPGGYRPATSIEVTTEDTLDLNTGTAIVEALEWLSTADMPVTFITVPRGLTGETPGLYPPEHLESLLDALPRVDHHHLDGFNHYTVVMSDGGARALAAVLFGS